MLNILLIVGQLAAADQTTTTCSQIKGYVAAFGKQTVIAGAKKHGYTDKQIESLLKRCKIVQLD